MKVSEWINLAVKLDIDGLEWYAGFLEMADESNWKRFRSEVEASWKINSYDVLFAGLHSSRCGFSREGN